MSDTPELSAHAPEQPSFEAALHRALERDEFVLHYQPKVDLTTGQVAEVEALIRWQDPERGMLLPLTFLPIAEETGLIVPIGDWVIRTACAQNKAWQDQSLAPVRVTVNLSMRQFDQRGLVGTIQNVLAETGLERRYLGLELTESMMMYNIPVALEAMSKLRAIGVQLALDNFGTGYSSLSYLRRLPIDVLQIDRSFVPGIDSDADRAALVIAEITMAHSLGLRVLAEGVEKDSQLALLRAHGCDMMQGYLFSNPLPAEELAELLREGRSLPGSVPGRDF